MKTTEELLTERSHAYGEIKKLVPAVKELEEKLLTLKKEQSKWTTIYERTDRELAKDDGRTTKGAKKKVSIDDLTSSQIDELIEELKRRKGDH